MIQPLVLVLLLNSIQQPKFLVWLISAEYLLSFTLLLSKNLQLSDIDMASAVDDTENVTSRVKDIRTDVENTFRKLFQDVTEKVYLIGATISQPRTIKRQIHRCNIISENAEGYFHVSVFVLWLECFISQIEERILSQKDIVKQFICLFPGGNSAIEENCPIYKNC